MSPSGKYVPNGTEPNAETTIGGFTFIFEDVVVVFSKTIPKLRDGFVIGSFVFVFFVFVASEHSEQRARTTQWQYQGDFGSQKREKRRTSRDKRGGWAGSRFLNR